MITYGTVGNNSFSAYTEENDAALDCTVDSFKALNHSGCSHIVNYKTIMCNELVVLFCGETHCPPLERA